MNSPSQPSLVLTRIIRTSDFTLYTVSAYAFTRSKLSLVTVSQAKLFGKPERFRLVIRGDGVEGENLFLFGLDLKLSSLYFQMKVLW